jgi:L-seryl-tRNA(Ser) seleniumtransferase
MSDAQKLLRKLPSVDRLLGRSDVAALARKEGRTSVTEAVRSLLRKKRLDILGKGSRAAASDATLTADEISGELEAMRKPSLVRVVNATGVVIHTNLGRAPLPAASLDYLRDLAAGFSNLEYSLMEGRRGSRYDHIERIVSEITGAEAAHVVNNNAAGLLLTATALASGRDIIISRGELIEIGDGFRIPDVMQQGGGRLVEVGTTNRTRPEDYERAIGERTGLIVKAHASNFYMDGFVEDTPIEKLVEMGRRYSVPVLYDIGSGALELPATLSSCSEPMVRRAVASGADIVAMSGDKVLGGPQAGILAGRKDMIAVLRRHPLTRALRPCKLTITLLHHVLLLYRHGRQQEIPVYEMISRDSTRLRKDAGRLGTRLRRALDRKDWTVEVDGESSKVGGGALPREVLESWVVRVRHRRRGAGELEARLRLGPVPILCRVRQDSVVIDMRTLLRGDEDRIVEALKAAG